MAVLAPNRNKNMETEEKKVDTTTEQPAPVTETKTEEAPVVTEEKKTEEVAVDYKAELERVQKQLSKAEYKLTQKDIEERRASKSKDDESSLEDLESEKEVISDLVNREVQRAKEELAAENVFDAISNASENPDERTLIKWYYDNKIVKTGFTKQEIIQDVQSAKILANRLKFEKRMDEVKEALNAKKNENNIGQTTGQQEMQSATVKLTPMEERILARQGLSAKDIKS